MVTRYSNAEGQMGSALTYDFAFEILERLGAVGMTTDELVEKLPGTPAHQAVRAHLNRMQSAGFLFRFPSDKTFEWWVNRKGIADAAARLAEIATALPERSLEMVSEVSRQNASVSRLSKFFSVSYRRDILNTLRRHPATPGEIYKIISPGVGPHEINASLQRFQELSLVYIKIKLISKQIGGFNVKEYNITPRGIAALHAFASDNPTMEIARAATLC